MVFLVILATQGATLLLSGSPPAASHVIDAAFGRQGPQGHGRQLVSAQPNYYTLSF